MIGASRWWTVTSSQSPTWATASDVVVVGVGEHHVVEIDGRGSELDDRSRECRVRTSNLFMIGRSG
jgi:hypothetical protein